MYPKFNNMLEQLYLLWDHSTNTIHCNCHFITHEPNHLPKCIIPLTQTARIWLRPLTSIPCTTSTTTLCGIMFMRRHFIKSQNCSLLPFMLILPVPRLYNAECQHYYKSGMDWEQSGYGIIHILSTHLTPCGGGLEYLHRSPCES
jgi:hypothetical protein